MSISFLAKLTSLFSPRGNPQPPIPALPYELILKIFELLPLQALGRASSVCKQWHALGSDKSLWNALLKKEPNVRNLDNENLRLIGFPQVSNPTVHPRELLKAAKIACRASEDGGATIVTLPAGWSYDDLEKLSENAVKAGIHSAKINFSDCWKELLRKTPIKEEQTVVLTDTVIHDTRNKSVNEQTSCLKAKGFKEGLPDGLTVLTMIVLTRIITKGRMSLYNWDYKETYTRFSNQTAKGWHLVGGSAPSKVDVNFNIFDNDCLGVGGLRKFLKATETGQ